MLNRAIVGLAIDQRDSCSSVFGDVLVKSKVDVGPDAHGTKSYVNVGECDPQQTAPGPDHVLTVQTTDAVVAFRFRGRAGENIHPAADEMSQRMATQCVSGQQKDVHTQHESPDANAEVGEFPIAIFIKKESAKRVVRQDEQKQDGKVQEIPVDVLQNQW